MKIPSLLVCSSLLHAALGGPLARTPDSISLNRVPEVKRQLGGLIGGDTPPTSTTSHITATTSRSASNPQNTDAILGGLLTDAEGSTKTKPTTTGTPSPTSYSIIGTPPPLSDSITASPTTSSTSTSASAMSTTPTPSATNSSSFGSITSGSAQWKVIGVVVIVVSVIGAAILIVVFFDQWSRFLSDMLCGKKTIEGVEDLVPDWEKRSWEFKLSNGESRYPSLDTLPSEAKIMQANEDYEDVHPFPARPSPVHVPHAFSPVAQEANSIPLSNMYANNQPGAENSHTTVQLPSTNVFGGVGRAA